MEDLMGFSVKDLEDFLQKEATGRELKKEEGVTHERVETRPEQYEQFKWMSQLEQEVARTKETVESFLKNKEEEQEVRRPVRSLIKPRDIQMLNPGDLQGIEAEGRLTVFLSQVESCSEDVEERKRILMTRVDPQLALLIQNALGQHDFRAWNTLTYWLCEELTDNNVDRILNSISEVKYDCMEDPQDFANKLKCKYAILEAKSKYPGEIPQRVETERAFAIGRDTNIMFAVNQLRQPSEITPASQSSPPNTQEQSQGLSGSQSEVRELRAQMEVMGRKLQALKVGNDQKPSSLARRRDSQMFCPYCRMNNHSAADCRRKTNSNACFDCWREGCR
ncbi:hypothetical protein GWK47_019342 [Chionoecetes opilio]|uniref:Uncharacterized protein n=1 Tax=Chionoecetes opilio TaxID=41210 RepID=A0A8J4XU54_CHIOP|nr:hypothetical protein GWK47_019342 [Chionoecetes opilio]